MKIRLVIRSLNFNMQWYLNAAKSCLLLTSLLTIEKQPKILKSYIQIFCVETDIYNRIYHDSPSPKVPRFASKFLIHWPEQTCTGSERQSLDNERRTESRKASGDNKSTHKIDFAKVQGPSSPKYFLFHVEDILLSTLKASPYDYLRMTKIIIPL